VRAQRNDVLYEQGDPPESVLVIAHGAVLLEWARLTGTVVGFRLAVAGDNFGVRSFCADQPRAASARAVRETLAVVVPADALHYALASEPRLWRSLARVVARDAGPQLSKIVRNGRIPVRARLAYLLDHLDERLGEQVASPIGHPDSPLKQRDLAHLLDVTDETVSRARHTLDDEGLIMTDPATGAIEVPDRERLMGAFRVYL
jgi:CRP-like cAMP-binding protein